MEELKMLELGGEHIVKEIIKRSKDKDIIYLTEDIVLNTHCVKQLAEYIENLIARNKELEENNKLLIQGKFREVANKNKYIKEMYIPKSKVKEKAEDLEKRGYFEEAIVLQELIED